MSFILDAIAKSERERQQQEIPDARILAMPVSGVHQPRRILPYIVAAALMLIVVLLLIWMQTGRTPFNGFSQTQNNDIQLSAVNQTAAPDSLSTRNEAESVENDASTSSIRQVVAIDGAISRTPAANHPKPLQQPLDLVIFDEPSAEKKAQTQARVDDTQGGLKQTLESAAPQEIIAKADDNSNGAIATEMNTQAGDIGAEYLAEETGIQESAEPAPRRVFRLVELPADVRRDLPTVSFSGHLFSKNVNVSYVMVNGGRSVIAGQQIVGDLFLHKVTPAGAIVDFRGYLIEVGILQNWSLK